MKSKDRGLLWQLLSFLIVAALLLTGCPDPNKNGDSAAPKYASRALVGNTIEITFDKDLNKHDAAKITVRQGESTLTIKTDYSLEISDRKLLIELKGTLSPGNTYAVTLEAGAVTGTNGKTSAVPKSPVAPLTIATVPTIKGTPSFEANSNTKLVVSLNTALEAIDTGKIKVQAKAAAAGAKFAAVSATPKLHKTDKTQIDITLKTAATSGSSYRVVVDIGALTSTDGVANSTKITSSPVVYSRSPILDAGNPPYILGKKLVATFNMNIALVAGAKVEVYKGSAKPGTKVTGTSASVKSAIKTLLEVSLPNSETPAVNDVYRLKLRADAVSKEGDTKNKNAAFTSSDITITALARDTTQNPYMVGRKIYVTFASAIEYVDSAKIKVDTETTDDGAFDNLLAPTAPSVINPGNDKQVVITVNETSFTPRHYYRVHLESGAVGAQNSASENFITTQGATDIEITAGPDMSGITPVFSSETRLSVTLPVSMKLILPASALNTIKVEKKDDGGTFAGITPSNVAIDDDNSNKVNITLNNAATPYTQTWKITFPAGSVLDVAKSSANNLEQTTAEVKPRLSDIYSWKKVLADGVPVKDNRWTARRHHSSVVFQNKIWVMGGHDGNRLNDVWSSADGITWTEERAPVDVSKDDNGDGNPDVTDLWSGRYGHSSVVFDGKIWVMGGTSNIDPVYRNDVWSSADGITWTEERAPVDVDKDKDGISNFADLWSGRRYHTSVVFDDKIWVLGGADLVSNYGYLNDVWSSTNGSTWNKIAPSESAKRWPVRDNHEAVVANGKIWIMGGFGDGYRKDVWYGDGAGKDWEEAQSIPTASGYASSVLFKSRIWLLGGVGKKGSDYYKHVFSLAEVADETTDWVPEESADWTARSAHSSVVFDGKIWVLGGDDGTNRHNEVWSFGVQD